MPLDNDELTSLLINATMQIATLKRENDYQEKVVEEVHQTNLKLQMKVRELQETNSNNIIGYEEQLTDLQQQLRAWELWHDHTGLDDGPDWEGLEV